MPTMTVRMASINTALLDTFREETTDGLDRLEGRLLELLAQRDPSLVDELFRVVHTIKGGAGAFGMTQMARIAHRMESVLDAYRAGVEPTRPAVTTLLDGADALRRLLAGGSIAPDQDSALERRLEEEAQHARSTRPGPAPAASPATPATASPAPTAPAAELGPPEDPHAPTDDLAPATTRHTLRVSPRPALFRQQVDPVLLFDQLTSQGEFAVRVDLSAVPPFAELDPTSCHLAWTLEIAGGDAGMIEALFGWLGDICPIAIETRSAAATSPARRASPAPPQGSAPAPRASPALLPASAPQSSPRASSPQALPRLALPPPVTAPKRSSPQPPARPASPQLTTAIPLTGSGAPAPGATIRVRLDKLDALMELVGDLVVTQSTLCAIERARGGADRRTESALDDLQRLTRALQHNALQLRSMPISSVLDRFPRLVHDLAGKLGKEIALEVGGDTIEVDRTVLERIGDPLVHLIRNCVDHGIEPPDVRAAAHKPRTGRIRIAVEQRGDEVTITIRDDGRGLDPARILARARERNLIPPGRALTEDEIHRLIFLPGFSTVEQVSDLSGRGVGMDVVLRTIQELGGDVELQSQPREGTSITLRLPLTLAIVEGQLVRCGGRTWVVPLSHVVECERLDPRAVTRLLGQRPVYRVHDELVPMIDLGQRLALARTDPPQLVLVVEAGGQQRALMIDEVGARQQVVVKNLSSQLARVDDIAGATVLGNGTVAFILDVAGLCSSGDDAPAA